MSSTANNLWYIKYYSLSRKRQVKEPKSYISYNCQKILRRKRRPTIIMKIRKNIIFLKVINKRIIYTLFKDYNNNRKRVHSVTVSGHRTLPNILRHRATCWIFKQAFFKFILIWVDNVKKILLTVILN